MGRLTTSVGIRLGKTNVWQNFGVVTNKTNSLKYLNFLKNISSILFLGKLQQQNYLFAKGILVEEKKILVLKLYFYKIDAFNFIIKYRPKLWKLFFLKKINKLRKKNKTSYNKNYKEIIFIKKNNLKNKISKLNRFSETNLKKNKKIKKIIFFKRNFIEKKYLKEKNKFFSLKKKYLKNQISLFKNNVEGTFYLRILNKLKSYDMLLTGLTKNLIKKIFIKIKQLKLLHQLNDFYNWKVQKTFLNNFVILKKLKTLFWLKNEKKVFKIYKLLLLNKKFQLTKNNLLSLQTKQNFFIKYLIKMQISKGLKKRKIFKLLYKKKFIIKQSAIFFNKKTIKIRKKKYLLEKKIFLLELLRIEKMILQHVKLYLKQDFYCKYYIITNYNFTAQVLTKYLCIKLKQRFTIWQIIWPLKKYLDKLIKKHNLFGYRIEFAGRFSRKQRATFLLFKGGTVPLATIINNIDYSMNFVILKDGIGNIKVWLNKTSNFQEAIVSFK